MSEDLTILESLSYRPVKSSSATLGMNSVVIRPETKVNKAEDVGQILEQPNRNKIIILEIECLISQVNEKLGKLPINEPELYSARGQALEEIDKFQKTTLVELKKAFKD